MPAPDPGRPRKFTKASLDRVWEPFYAEADPLGILHVTDVLVEITDGTWARRREWVVDPWDPRVYTIRAHANVVVTIMVPTEYPSFAVLVRIGPLQDP